MKSGVIYVVSVATIAAVVVYSRNPTLLTGIVALLSLVVILADWSVGRLIVYLFTFCAALTAEIVIVNSGVWTYSAPNIFGIPFWIPFVWVNGAFFFIQLQQDIAKYLRK